MTHTEAILHRLAPEGLPDHIRGRKIPSLRHCVGTGKLIGALYGRTICEECGIDCRATIRRLTELSCLLRAYIVIDDFLKDSGVDLSERKVFNLWLLDIANACKSIVSVYADKPNELWARYEEVYEQTYSHFDTACLFESVIRKCYPIFLPFELWPIASASRCPQLLVLMKEYLFALQLIDDFQDIEEDLNSPKNHNLFLSGTSVESALMVIEARALFVRSLFSYIEANLITVRRSLTGETFARSIDHSLSWIREKSTSFRHLPMIPFFSGSFPDYTFPLEVLTEAASTVPRIPMPDMDDIRAENMHTTDCHASVRKSKSETAE